MTFGPDVLRLDGRVAVVTGAANGIGHGVAAGFGGLGAGLGVCDRDEHGLAELVGASTSAGVEVVDGVVDVRDREAMHAFVDRVVERFGHIDILVNNAGGGFAASFLEVTDKGQDSLIRENFTSVADTIRLVTPYMPDGSSIVNITSIEAHRAGPAFAIYSAMKAAVTNLTKSLALELAVRRIRVNCVAPDVISTPGIGEMRDDAAVLPVRGDVDDVLGAALFLVTELSRFVTGSTIHVDGGNQAAGGWKRGIDGTYGV